MHNGEVSVKSVAYHRNGIAGEGFHVVLFAWKQEGRRKPRNMQAIRFDAGGDFVGCKIAVLDVDLAHSGNVVFGENSRRGDEFVHEIDKAIKGYADALDAANRQALEEHVTGRNVEIMFIGS